MKTSHLGALGALVLFCSLPSAASASTWAIHFDSGDPTTSVIAQLNIDDTLNAAGAYTVLGISGTVGGNAITGLVPNPNQPFTALSANLLFFYDGNFNPFATPQLSNPGLLFNDAAGYQDNLFSNSSTDYELLRTLGISYNVDAHGAFTSSAAPEPAGWALMVGGFGGIGGLLRLRKRIALA